MKKRLLLLVTLSAFIFFATKVNASKCDATKLTEIKNDASKVKLSYEEVEEKLTGPTVEGGSDVGYEYDIYESYLKVTISNITDDLYVKVINDADNSTKTFTSKDAVDGVVTFNWKDTNKVANLTLKVYTSSNTSCPDEDVLTNYKTLPMKNEYYTWTGCTENPDASICKKYVTEEVTYESYQKLANKEQKKKAEKVAKENEENKVVKFVKKNKKGFIIGGSIIIVVGVVTTTVVIIKRRGSRII